MLDYMNMQLLLSLPIIFLPFIYEYGMYVSRGNKIRGKFNTIIRFEDSIIIAFVFVGIRKIIKTFHYLNFLLMRDI